MKAVPVWLRYTLLRVLLFIAPLAVLLIAGVTPWIAVLVAALFGFSASLLFLRRQREEFAGDLYSARHRPAPVAVDDAEAEDAAIDGTPAPSAAEPTAGTDAANGRRPGE